MVFETEPAVPMGASRAAEHHRACRLTPKSPNLSPEPDSSTSSHPSGASQRSLSMSGALDFATVD